jgi:FkbM family methyltransferase
MKLRLIVKKLFAHFKPPATNNLIFSPIITDINKLCNGALDVVFDIGAHHGNYSLELTKLVNVGVVYCCEPNEVAFRILKSKLNKSIFRHLNLALSNFSGTSPFYLNEFEETNSLLPRVETKSSIDRLTANRAIVQVGVETLDSVCSKNSIKKISLLKIDAQGNSLDILKGASELLKSKLIGIIQCEVEFIEIYKNEGLFHSITLFLEQHGYFLYSLYNIHYDINNRISWADALFVQNVDTH